MHRRVWSWRWLAHRCDTCGLDWPRSLRRCLDEALTQVAWTPPSPADRPPGFDWTGPTMQLQPFHLTRGQLARTGVRVADAATITSDGWGEW